MATEQEYGLLFSKHLQEKSARVLTVQYNPLLKTREMLRFWPLDQPSMTQASIEALYRYGSALNFPVKRTYIVDPFTDRTEDFRGTWRVVSVRGAKHGEAEGIYQTLREGWAATLAEDEARFFNVQGNAATGTLSFGRAWYNLQTSLTAGLAGTLSSTATVTNPKLEGVQQTGTFASSGVQAQPMDGDGAGMVIQTLTQITSLSSSTGSTIAAELATRKYLRSRDNEILDLFNLETGESDALACVFSNMNPADETKCMETVSDAQLVSALASGWTYAGRNWKVEASGGATFTVAFRQMAWNAWAGNSYTSYNTIDYANSGRDGERRVKTWENLRIADLTTAVDYLKTDSNSDAGFHVLSVNVSNARNGSFTVSQTTIAKVQEIASSDGNLTGQRVGGVHGFHKTVLDTKESVYENFSATEVAALNDTVPAGYKLVAKLPAAQDGGLYAVRFQYEKLTVRAWGKDANGGTYTAPDITDHGNAGSGERNVLRQVWSTIQIADMDAAVAALRNGTTGYAATSGYIITDVNVTGGGDGAFDVTRVQRKQVNAVDVTGINLIDPHALQQGVMTRVTLRYDSFTEGALPDPSGYVPGSNAGVVSNEVEGPDGNGLFSRVIVTETPVWRAFRTGTPGSYSYAAADITDYPNAGTDREGILKTWLGIQKADISIAAEALRTGLVAATSGYVITDVGVRPGPAGSIVLTQSQRKTVSVDLTGMHLIDPHALQQGVMTRTTLRYDSFKEADLPNPNGYIPGVNIGVISNDVDGPDGNGFYTRVIVTETPTWRAWANNLAADLTDYPNAGTDAEAIVKTWLGVRQADLNTAVQALRGGSVAPASGYVITEVGVRPGPAGSIVLTQTQRKSITAALDHVELLDPHGLAEGLMTRVVTRYEGFTAAGLPSGASVAIGTAIISNRETGPDGNGLYGREVVSETPTWRTWASRATIPDITEYDGKGTQRERKIRQWLGIRKADLDAAVNALVSAESGYGGAVSVRVSEGRAGSVSLTQTQRLKGANIQDTDQIVLQPHNFKSGTLYRVTIIYDGLAVGESVSVTAPVGYIEVRRKLDTDSDGTQALTVQYEKVTWNAFAFSGHSILEDSFPEGIRSNVAPVTVRVKTWLNVQKADMTAAISTLWTTRDSGYFVDEVRPRNNSDGSVDLVQVSSYVNTAYSLTWEESERWYWVLTYFDGAIIGRTRKDEMWNHTVKYFTNEDAARAWTGATAGSYGSGVNRITPNAWRAELAVHGTDRNSGW